MLRQLLALFTIISAALTSAAGNPVFVDHSRPDNFLDIDIHALAGGSYIT